MRRSKTPMTPYQAESILGSYDSIPKQRAGMEDLIGIRYHGKLNGKPLRFYNDKQLYRVSERLLGEARKLAEARRSKISQQDRTRQEVKETKQRRIDEAIRHTDTLIDKLAASQTLLWEEHKRLCDYHNIPSNERPSYTLSQLEDL